jgi:hypothetical protein
VGALIWILAEMFTSARTALGASRVVTAQTIKRIFMRCFIGILFVCELAAESRLVPLMTYTISDVSLMRAGSKGAHF